jgi:hypothetical protein
VKYSWVIFYELKFESNGMIFLVNSLLLKTSGSISPVNGMSEIRFDKYSEIPTESE